MTFCDKVSVTVVFLLGLLFSFPAMSGHLHIAFFTLLIIYAWLVLVALSRPSFYRDTSNQFLLLVYAILIIYPCIQGNLIISNRYAAMPIVAFGCLLYKYFKKYIPTHVTIKVCLINLILTFFSIISTLTALLHNPFASRSIKMSGAESIQATQANIGGYHFIYYLTACSLPILFLSIVSEKKLLRYFFALLYLLVFFCILKSSYTTAFLALIASSTALLTIYFRVLASKKSLVKPFLVLVLFFLVGSIFVAFQDVLRSYIPPRIAKALFKEGDYNILESIFHEFVRDRWPHMSESLISIAENPLFGLSGCGRLHTNHGYLVGFSQHSYLLDSFALYGTLIGIAILLSFYINISTKKHTLLHIPTYILSVVLYFFNNAIDSIAFVLCFYIPFISDYYKNKAYI